MQYYINCGNPGAQYTMKHDPENRSKVIFFSIKETKQKEKALFQPISSSNTITQNKQGNSVQ